MRVYVYQSHIENGNPGEGNACPIALALKARGLSALVDGDRVVFRLNNDITLGIKLPRSARRFIARFDNKKHVKPFAFEIGIDLNPIEL